MFSPWLSAYGGIDELRKIRVLLVASSVVLVAGLLLPGISGKGVPEGGPFQAVWDYLESLELDRLRGEVDELEAKVVRLEESLNELALNHPYSYGFSVEPASVWVVPWGTPFVFIVDDCEPFLGRAVAAGATYTYRFEVLGSVLLMSDPLPVTSPAILVNFTYPEPFASPVGELIVTVSDFVYEGRYYSGSEGVSQVVIDWPIVEPLEGSMVWDPVVPVAGEEVGFSLSMAQAAGGGVYAYVRFDEFSNFQKTETVSGSGVLEFSWIYPEAGEYTVMAVINNDGLGFGAQKVLSYKITVEPPT